MHACAGDEELLQKEKENVNRGSKMTERSKRIFATDHGGGHEQRQSKKTEASTISEKRMELERKNARLRSRENSTNRERGDRPKRAYYNGVD